MRAAKRPYTKAGPVPLYSFVVVYQHDAHPVRIVAVLRGRRNPKRILKERLRIPPAGDLPE
jgi:hypothetical protein